LHPLAQADTRPFLIPRYSPRLRRTLLSDEMLQHYLEIIQLHIYPKL
jgi:hypothetical protein